MASLHKLLFLCTCYLIACSAAVPASGDERSLWGQRERYLGYLQASDVLDFFKTPWHIGVVAGGGGALLILVTLVATVVGCCCCYKRRTCCFKRHRYHMERRPLLSSYRSPDALYMNKNAGQVEVGTRRGGRRYEKTVGEELQRQKKQQEHSDSATAKKIVLFHMRNEKRFELTKDLPDMGSRMLKFWFKICDQDGRERLLTIAPVSQKCPLFLDDKTTKTVNNLLRQLSHTNLHRVLSVHYVNKDRMVLITQPFMKGGSLKDTIYRSTPTSEWTMKYSRRSKGLSAAKIALYGRQILEGLRYLYSHNFPQLGHVQTGNIFVEKDICRIGGFENTILGYKTRSFKVCKEHLEYIDLILFGHVVFEMSCGYELAELVAGDQHYADVKDHSVKEVLEFIFSRNQDGTFAHSIDQVYNLDFFQAADPPIPRGGGRADHTELSNEIKTLLAKVAKNKPRVQKVMNRRKKRSGKSMTSHTSPSDADSAAAPETAQTDVPPS